MHQTSIKIEAKQHYFVKVMEPKVKMPLLIQFIHSIKKKKALYHFVDVMNKNFTVKTLLNIASRLCTCVANEVILRRPYVCVFKVTYSALYIYKNACALLSHILNIVKFDWP